MVAHPDTGAKTTGSKARAAGSQPGAEVRSPSRPSRRARSSLRRDAIVEAAIRTAENGQLASLSMRGLADELDVTAMALYGHVADKDDLLDEVLDHFLARDAQPAPFRGEWSTWMVDFAEQLHVVLTAQPALLDRYLRRPVGVPAALRRMEAALAVLSSVGFDDDECTDIFAMVHTLTLGFTALEVARRTNISGTSTRREASNPLGLSHQNWPLFFGTLQAEEFPNLTRLRPDLAEFTSGERLRRALTALLRGLQRDKQQPASLAVEPSANREVGADREVSIKRTAGRSDLPLS